MDILSIVSLVTGIVSIVLAIVAMFFSASTAKKSQDNFNHTQEIMQAIYEKTKDALADIDKKSAIIETIVQKNQNQMLSTITDLLMKE